MNWFYHTTKNWDSKGYKPAQEILLRAIEEGSESEGEVNVSNIIEISVFAMDFYFALAENPMDEEKYRQIYTEELSSKDYFLEELKIDKQEDYMLLRAALYLKTDKFNKDDLLAWVHTCFSIWGFEIDELKESDLSMFPETNPILSIFSLDNVKAFEDKLGKNWWKRSNEEE